MAGLRRRNCSRLTPDSHPGQLARSATCARPGHDMVISGCLTGAVTSAARHIGAETRDQRHVGASSGVRSLWTAPRVAAPAGVPADIIWRCGASTRRRVASEGLLRLAQAWHARVMADEVVSHAFSHGFHPQHTERLAAYWAEALGGPTTYSDAYGDETSVVRIHSGNGPHEEMDHRAIACFDQALHGRRAGRGRASAAGAARLLRLGHHHDHVALPRLRRRRPRGLSIPRWSWDGLQR